MNLKRFRILLVEKGKRLVDVHRQTGIPYNRLVRLANAYCEPREAEILLIADALEVSATDLTQSE